MDELAGLIADAHARWTSRVVESVLGSSDPVAVAEILVGAIAAALGVGVTGALFYESGVGIVTGVVLADARAVVAKVHRADYQSSDHLAAVIEVQAELAASGLPAPAPLAGPLRLGHGWLTVEEYRPADRADGYDPAVRRQLAITLHAFVSAAGTHAHTNALGSWMATPVIDSLWPEPHDLRFDFTGTATGAEWIDDTARAARAVLVGTIVPAVVGHFDWRVQGRTWVPPEDA